MSWPKRLIVIGLLSAAAARAADPVIGTWVLIPAKSKYLPGPAPRSQTRIYEETVQGIKATVKTVDAKGRVLTVEYPSTYDGKEHTVTGDPATDGIVMKTINDHSADSVLMHAGHVIGNAKRTVAEDGKSMIITYQGETGGEKVNNIGYYERR